MLVTQAVNAPTGCPPSAPRRWGEGGRLLLDGATAGCCPTLTSAAMQLAAVCQQHASQRLATPAWRLAQGSSSKLHSAQLHSAQLLPAPL